MERNQLEDCVHETSFDHPTSLSMLVRFMKRHAVDGLVDAGNVPDEGGEEEEERGGTVVKKTAIIALEEVEAGRFRFKDGGTYWAVSKTSEIANWSRSLITGFENEAAEFGLLRMKDSHPDAVRVCRKKFTSPDKKIKVEIDSLIQAKDCALVIECKTTLSDDSLVDLQNKFTKIEAILESSEELKKPQVEGDATFFAARKFKGALAGRRITDDAGRRRALLNGAAQKGWEIWLPNGSGLSVGDHCIEPISSKWHVVTSCIAGSGSCPSLSLRPSGPRPPSCRLHAVIPGSGCSLAAKSRNVVTRIRRM